MKIVFNEYNYDFIINYGSTREDPFADIRIICPWKALYNPDLTITWEVYSDRGLLITKSIDVHTHFKSKRQLLNACAKLIKKDMIKNRFKPLFFRYNIKKILSQNLKSTSYKDTFNQRSTIFKGN